MTVIYFKNQTFHSLKIIADTDVGNETSKQDL